MEELPVYEFVDYWDGDTTAIGMKKGNILIYISAFNFPQTHHYDIVIEELETGNVLKSESNKSYTELVIVLQLFLS